MKETLVARRYAKALVETHAGSDRLEPLVHELKDLAVVFAENASLNGVMRNPAVPAEVKRGTLDDILAVAKATEGASAALRVLLRNGRIGILDEVVAEFEVLSFVALGKVRVEIRSAMKLSDKDASALADKLSKFTGKTAVVKTSVDPSLIGGVVAKVGSKVYDGSVKNQLLTLRAGL